MGVNRDDRRTRIVIVSLVGLLTTSSSMVGAALGLYVRSPSACLACVQVFVGSGSHVAIFSQTVTGGAVLAVVAHAMIPESIHEGESLVVLPTVAGFSVRIVAGPGSVVRLILDLD